MNIKHLIDPSQPRSTFNPRTMSKILLTAMLLFSLSASAQTVTRDASGNFHQAPRVDALPHDSTTTYTFTDEKGTIHPVYVGRKGAYYVWVTSSKGTMYRRYLTTKSE